MICDVARASRWGLGSAGLGGFAARSPGNSAAASAAYWCAHTSALLAFENSHPARTLRLRHEDMAVNTATVISSISQFLGPDDHQPDLPGQRTQAPVRSAADDVAAEGTDSAQQVPVELIPAAMLERVNSLHATLGYPALAQLRGAGGGT